jgi:nucleoside-diphosphate-sugar epimerase
MGSKTAVIVGGLGVIGRNLLHQLERLAEWEIVGLSRRAPDFETRARFVSVDLLNREETRERLAGLREATHVFYCAFQARPTWAEHGAPNLAMLVNAVEAIEAASSKLRHVQLIEGTKWYGSHLGPFKTPAREDDPPHMLPNFYYDQEMWLRAHQEGKPWSWSALRPQTVCGFALGNPMNIATVIATYAAISKELGLPLRFPGKPGAWRAIYQVTDADLLAEAMMFCATEERAANDVYNITNGDFFRWQYLWPKLARFYGLEPGEVQTIPLVEFMADKEPVWRRIVEKHGLRPTPYQDIAAWPFADYVFGCEWDVMSDTLKIRAAGFHRYERSDEMFLRLFLRFRELRALP